MSAKKLDLSGILLSLGCLLHCVIFPYLLSGLTILGIDILDNIYIELLLVVSAGIIGGLSFFRKKRQHKRSRAVMYIFIIGYILLITKLFFQENEQLLSIFALLAISAAHIWNYIILLQINKEYNKKCAHASCSLSISNK